MLSHQNGLPQAPTSDRTEQYRAIRRMSPQGHHVPREPSTHGTWKGMRAVGFLTQKSRWTHRSCRAVFEMTNWRTPSGEHQQDLILIRWHLCPTERNPSPKASGIGRLAAQGLKRRSPSGVTSRNIHVL